MKASEYALAIRMYDAALVLAPSDDSRTAGLIWLDKSRAVAIAHGAAYGIQAAADGISAASHGSGLAIDAKLRATLSELFIAAGTYFSDSHSHSSISSKVLEISYRCFISALRLHPHSTDALMNIANIAPKLRTKAVQPHGGTQVSSSTSNVLFFSCVNRIARLGYFNRPNGPDFSEALRFFDVAMSVNELQAFHSSLLFLLESRALFFEFGVGGSTRYARSVLPAAQMFGLDSSRDWVSDLSREMADLAGRLRWIDIGPTEGWGYPVAATEQQHSHLFPAYSAAIFDWMSYAGGIGLTLIDGRFRVACAASAGSTECFLQRIPVTFFCSPGTTRR
jgi:hypothetical protein